MKRLTILALVLALLGMLSAAAAEDGMAAVPVSTPEELAAAIGNPNNPVITFLNPAPGDAWPMLIQPMNDATGHACLVTSNAGVPGSACAVTASFHAEAGEVLVLLCQASTEFGCDELILTLNGEEIKRFSGDREGLAASFHPISQSGDYIAELRYVKDESGDYGADCVWIDGLSLVSAEQAAEMAAYLPRYSFSDAAGLAVCGAAREITLKDEIYMASLWMNYGANLRMLVVPQRSVELQAMLTADMDVDNACLGFNSLDAYASLFPFAYEDGFFVTINADTLADTGRACTAVHLHASPHAPAVQTLLLFVGEENLTSYLRTIYSDPSDVQWRYADEADWRTLAEEVYVAPDLDDRAGARYRFKAYSLEGMVLAGVQIAAVSDSGAYTFTTDVTGNAIADLPADTYRISVGNLNDGDEVLAIPESLGPEGGNCILIVGPEE